MGGYMDGTIRKYLDDATAGIPAPGGGSVSAFAAALGTTMGSMAANFTVGRGKFQAVEPEVKGILERLASLRETLVRLADEDVAAYKVVSVAYGLPKGPPDEKALRAQEIQEALEIAMKPPLETMRAAVAALREFAALAPICNPRLISDVGVAAIICEAGLRGARLNVEVNRRMLEDKALVERTGSEVAQMSAEAARLLGVVTDRVEHALLGESGAGAS
jgi:methenyltetrahydrofolate cyclohydrolase